MMILFGVIVCGLLLVVYVIWVMQLVLVVDQGNERMCEIVGYICEGV